MCFHVKYLISMLILGVRFIVRKPRGLKRVRTYLVEPYGIAVFIGKKGQIQPSQDHTARN